MFQEESGWCASKGKECKSALNPNIHADTFISWFRHSPVNIQSGIVSILIHPPCTEPVISFFLEICTCVNIFPSFTNPWGTHLFKRTLRSARWVDCFIHWYISSWQWFTLIIIEAGMKWRFRRKYHGTFMRQNLKVNFYTWQNRGNSPGETLAFVAYKINIFSFGPIVLNPTNTSLQKSSDMTSQGRHF